MPKTKRYLAIILRRPWPGRPGWIIPGSERKAASTDYFISAWGFDGWRSWICRPACHAKSSPWISIEVSFLSAPMQCFTCQKQYLPYIQWSYAYCPITESCMSSKHPPLTYREVIKWLKTLGFIPRKKAGPRMNNGWKSFRDVFTK
jgi:hypothetical protein